MPTLHTVLRLAKRTLVCSLLVLLPLNVAALTIENISFEESVRIDNQQIPIRGVALLR